MKTKKQRRAKARPEAPDATSKSTLSNPSAQREGTPVPFACPECNGPLFRIKNGKIVKFKCVVGHAFSPESLSEAHAEALERALWIALRSLNERLTLRRALVAKHFGKEERDLVQQLDEDTAADMRDIKLLKQILERR